MFGKYTVIKKDELAMFEELIDDLRAEKHALESRAEQATCRAEELAAMLEQERVAKLETAKERDDLLERFSERTESLDRTLQEAMSLTLEVEELRRENDMLRQQIAKTEG